jgi:hypothetical protein
VLAPEAIDEPFGRDGLIRPEQQQGQQRALIPPRERDGPSFVEHLERAEDPELQHAPVVTEVSGREKGRNYALAGG